MNSYLDRIIKAGFDGVWLDKVDEFEFYDKKPDAKTLMIAFVSKLAAHARARKAGFLVVPQNGEALLTDPAYRAVIDGIGKEDILYGETKDKRPNKPASIAANVAKLKLLTAEGKPVFAVEYLNSPEEIAKRAQATPGRTASFRISPTARSTRCASAICPAPTASRAKNSRAPPAAAGLDIAPGRCHQAATLGVRNDRR